MKTHRWKYVLRQLLFVGLCILAWSQSNLPLVAQTKQEGAEQAENAGPDKAPALIITLDTSQAPEMAKWAAEAKSRCEKFYPMLASLLGTPNFRQPLSVKMTFKSEPGVAGTVGTNIIGSAEWFKEHPDDYGALIHELCHVVQAYGDKKVPGWVTEGIADYVRWFKFEPAKSRPHVDPDTAKYTDGYQTTAAFFDWIVRMKDKSFVQHLNAAARNGKYSDDLFREYAHKPLDELWKEYVDSLKPAP